MWQVAADEMSYSESHVNKVCNLHISGLLTAAKCTNVCNYVHMFANFFLSVTFFIHGYSFMGVHILSTH